MNEHNLQLPAVLTRAVWFFCVCTQQGGYGGQQMAHLQARAVQQGGMPHMGGYPGQQMHHAQQHHMGGQQQQYVNQQAHMGQPGQMQIFGMPRMG